MMRGNRNLALFFFQSGNYGWAALFIVGMAAMWLASIYLDVWAADRLVAVDTEMSQAAQTMDPDSHAYRVWAEGAYKYYLEENPDMTPEERASLADQLGLHDVAGRVRDEAGIGGCAGGDRSRPTVAVGVPVGLLVAGLGIVFILVRQLGGLPPGLGRLVGTGGSPFADPAPLETPPPPEGEGARREELPAEPPVAEPPPEPRAERSPAAPSPHRPTLDEVQSTRAVRAASGGPGILQLSREDDGFSLAALLLFVHGLHRAMTQAAVSGDWTALSPYVVAGVRGALERSHQGVEQLAQLVLGAVDIAVTEDSREWVRLDLELTSTRFERVEGQGSRSLVVERWGLRRNAAAASPEPEVLLALGCPACAVPVSLDGDGRCTACERNVSWGQFGWQVVEHEYRVRRPLGQPQRHLLAPNPDHYAATSRIDPTLSVSLEALSRARPEFDRGRFFKRVGVAFAAAQEALSASQWQRARPYLADLALGELRVEIEEWKASGRRLVRREAFLDDWELVRAHVDPWYALLVVRVKFSALEFVLSKEGLVVEGSETERAERSAYWTFARGTSVPENDASPVQCASCMGDLDRVSPEGVCGYCGADLSSLEWSWMLLRTESVDAYQ